MATKSGSIGARLKEVRIRLKCTQEEFSKTLLGKENKATISAYENDRLEIAEKAKVILFTTLGVNADWLLHGKGPMFNADLTPTLSPQKKEVIPLGKHVPLRITSDQYSEAFGDWPGLPMYNAPVTASFVETYRDDTVYQPQYYLHDPRFRDCDFGAIITGDSMHSEIRHGDFIACKEVTDTRFIVFGDIYYVIATNGLETCKYVNVDPKDENRLLLVAKNEKISPSPLPKDMILRLFKVRGIVRGY